uniref:uncharacterized protein LOC105350151 n=1 Tax=Fragaria vesca subsp. vesca TaxID=101020 RepID=UPI0005C8FA18|nr:PREDICTED: uncharacterized protein LOC105350151 [Fragaria vesca subsp. vesca]
MSEDSNEFLKFVEDGDQPLYHGCDHTTKMNFLVESFNWKAKHVLSDACYGDFLEFIKGLLPEENLVPLMVNDAKKILSVLGMDYEKIHACPNDCILYRGEKYKEADVCPSCGVSRSKQPGNDIDVYLQPLIDDLKLLWNGVEGVYDAYRGEYFKLKAVLFWTINDFPTYGNLSRSIVRGYNGCPICVDQTQPHRLKKCNKLVFMRHRRGLPRHHPYRRQAAVFDNTVEEDLAAVPLTGEEVLARVKGLNCEFGKREESTPRVRIVDDEDRPCWKKKSIFFQLEYWKDIPVRHNLDVMHIEKNCCDSITGTLLNIPGKTKDGVAARLDMVAMGIRTELKPDVSGKRTKLPLAAWNCKLDEKEKVCGSFFGIKVPTGFSSNIRNLVPMEGLKLSKLKSHDCHVLMQVLLPVVLR